MRLLTSSLLFVFAGTLAFGQSQANLTPYKPTSWDDKIVVSTSTGTNQDSSSLEPSDTLYVDWTVLNNGTKSANSAFYIRLFLDDVEVTTWIVGSLNFNTYVPVQDYSIGSLTAGTHTLRIEADITNTINESNETDNAYTKTFTVDPGTPDIRIEPTTLTFTEAGEAPAPSSAPMYSQLSDKIKPRDWKVLLRSGAFEPSELSEEVIASLSEKAAPIDESAHLLVQFNDKLSLEERRELEILGVEILRYVPHNSYWISATPEARDNLSTLTHGGGIRWTSPSRWIDKLAPTARNGIFPPNAHVSGNRVAVRLVAFRDMDWTEVRDAVVSVGGRILEWTNDHHVTVSIKETNLDRLASLDLVEWVEPASGPPAANNVVSAERIQVDEIKSAPYGLDGSGVMVGVWDGGPIYPHLDFDTRLTVVDTGTSDDHATHVGGTIAGSGFGNSNATGMAPAAQLWSYDWNSPTTEMSSAYSSGVRLANHSWGYVTGWHEGVFYGSEDFGAYTSTSNEWDELVQSTGMIVFKSAGNDRNDGPDWPDGPDMDGPYDCIGQIGTSKNLITVGATEDNDTMSAFSSWGPVDDGRIKPDLCANGVGLYSTLTGDAYGYYSGTSMSTPSATGASALLHQLNSQVTGQDLRADTCKAVLIHGASDLGRPGPDYEFGWGLIDALASADLLAGQNYVLGAVPDSGSETYTVSVPSGATSLKVTLVWTDPAGSPSATLALVNDLDLVVTSPSSTITRPWILDKDNPTTNATRGVNSVDNVEQVLVDTPASGNWSIDVQGTSVPVGALQYYTLVCEYLSAAGLPQSFTIFNDGTGDLSVDPIALQSAAEWISWSPTGAITIPSGGSAKVNVLVDLDSAPAGTTTRRLLVTSDDPDESPYPAAVNIVVERLPEVQSIQGISGTMATGITAQWNCEEGYTYQLQYSDTLASGSWADMGPLQTPTTGQTVMSYVDSTTTGASGMRFYRIERLPAE